MESYTQTDSGNSTPRYHVELCEDLREVIGFLRDGTLDEILDFDYAETEVVLMGWIQGYGTVVCNGREVMGLAFELASNPVMALRIRLASRVIEQDYAAAYGLLAA